MAANDYYRDASAEHYYSHSHQNLLNPEPTFHSPYEPPSLSLSPSYHDLKPTVSSDQETLTEDVTPKLDTRRKRRHAQDSDYPPSPEGHAVTPLIPESQRQPKHKFFSKKTTWVVYILSVIQISVFIYEIAKNGILTGSPIEIHPQFNYMIGPSTYVQINVGARFVPCMRTTPGVQNATQPINWPCPNTTTTDTNAASNQCSLTDLCGFSGFNEQSPNQWWRFIVPIFLHAGIIHIGMNMFVQLTIGRDMEKAIGPIRFVLVYFSAGIFGFVLGGNYGGTAVAATGCSGSLFGIIALVVLDLIYRWNERQNPMRELMFCLVIVVISLGLGLLPGLDNFSHIGGFLMGLVLGICLLRSPNVLRSRIGEAPYRNVESDIDLSATKRRNEQQQPTALSATAKPANIQDFAKQPVEFFKNRKLLWWAWWLIRAAALAGMLTLFIVMIDNFYAYRDTCSWCKYLSCLPVNGWCNLGNLQLNQETGGTTSKREILQRSLLGTPMV